VLLSGKCPSYNFNINTKGEVTRVGYKTVVDIDCYELHIKTNHWEKEKSVAIFYVPIMEKDFETVERKLWGSAMYEHNPKNRSVKWKILADARAVFQQIKHGYAQTVHSTQGNTISNVVVDGQDIKSCHNPTLRKKLLYVGASRASTSLYII
jgi:hypothetical protein